MIPYDELVIALQTWRAKQGLPVLQLSGALTPPPAAAARTAPPMAPPPARAPAAVVSDDGLDVDDAALLEEAQYEPDGADFQTAFSTAPHDDGESTAIGSAPRPSDMTIDEDASRSDRGGRNEDW